MSWRPQSPKTSNGTWLLALGALLFLQPRQAKRGPIALSDARRACAQRPSARRKGNTYFPEGPPQ